jgi:glycosyltransferase involved in cell wall biosynthesis
MKKILHIIPTLGSGGAERQLVNLVATTEGKSCRNHVVAFGQSEFFGPEIRAAGAELTDLGLSGKHPWLDATRALKPIVRAFAPDVVCAWLYDAGVVSRFLRFTAGHIPTVCSLQLTNYEKDTVEGGNWSPVKIEAIRMIDMITAKIARPYFAACSEEVGRSYREKLRIDPAMMTTIYNGIDPATIASASDPAETRKIHRVAASDFVFLAVGRLSPQKNFPLMLRAFKDFVSVRPDAKLLIAGVGPDEEMIKSVATGFGLDENVGFLGRQKDVAALLKAADVFLMPSLFEGMPLALVEAMFAGLPAIVSNIPVMREAIEHERNGLMVDPMDHKALTAAMIEIASDAGLRDRLGAAALETASQKFHIAKIAADWEALFDRMS